MKKQQAVSGDSVKRQANIDRHRIARREEEEAKTRLREENEAARAKRTDAEQIEALDFRLGKGAGAVKERERLSK